MSLRDPGSIPPSAPPALRRLRLAAAQARADTARLPRREDALEVAAESMLVADSRRRTIYVNPAFEALTGYAAADMVGRSCAILQGAATSPETSQALRAALDAGRPFRGELLNYRKDGTSFWNEVTVLPVFDAVGTLVQFVGTQRDITARRVGDEQLLLASRAFEEGSEGFIIADAQRRIIKVNAAFTAISGYSEADVIGRDPSILSSGRHDQGFYRAMWQSVDEAGHWQGEIWNRRKDGTVYPQQLLLRRVEGSSGAMHYVASFSDISDRKAAQDDIWRLSHYDPLTGLPNRAYLHERATRALERSRLGGETMAVVFIDLDHFKNVNDSLGHRVGDELLVQVAKRFETMLRENDTLARFGGDEFVMLLPGSDARAASKVLRRMIDLAGEPLRVGGHELTITPSAGIAMYPFDGADFDSLATCADVAMYRAKDLGRNTFCFFTPEMQAQYSRALLLDNLLRRAIERGELHLEYQPQCAVHDGAIVGLEALLRWRSPELGQVPPGEFVPVAESSGLIIPIGEWALRTALCQMRAWLDAGIAPPVVAVNLSIVQFRQPGFPDHVRRILDECGVAPDRLELELTESVASDDPAGAMAVMEALHAHGIRLSLDDFGTGYSSLSYLKRFKVGKLKIDRSFVASVTDSPADQAIVSAIVRLANGLGMATLAEGVETPAQMEALRLRGCAEVQGYWLTRPFAPADYPAYREAHHASQSFLGQAPQLEACPIVAGINPAG
jgi:diguanylate cyclase (GGDEF)-like protein/PAS domain S-box-containing protein